MLSFQRSKFHVITMISNPARYARRYELYKEFQSYMHLCGIEPWTIELAIGDRPFEITDATNSRHIQLRVWDEIWHKENALNVLISRLPSDWETIAWIDADIKFVRPDWIEETFHLLQTYQIIQMWEHSVDLGPNHQKIGTNESFMSRYIKNGARFPEGGSTYSEWHPGYAWAARREAIDGMGKFYDKAILGAGDRHMCLAWVGQAAKSFHPEMQSAYVQDILDFENRCKYSIRKDVGFMHGTLLHSWHGKKKDRKYFDRWRILIDNQYMPSNDIKLNSDGIYHFNDDMSDRFIRLRDQIRLYFRQRSEDSIDLE